MAETTEDLLDTSTGGEGSNAPAPSVTPDLQEVLKSLLRDQLAEQYSGLQSAQDKAIARLEKKIATMQAAGLTAEQQAEVEDAERQREETRIRQQADLLRFRKKFPKAVDLWLELMDAEDTEAQLALIEGLYGKQVAAQVVQAAEGAQAPEAQTTPVPAVDRNNPAAGPRDATASDALSGAELTDDSVDALLKEYGTEKGIFARIRGKG